MRNILFIIISILIVGCSQPTVEEVYKQWINREVKIPNSIRFINNTEEDIRFDNKAKLKILMFTDSLGCMECKIKPREWQMLCDELDSVTGGSVSAYMVLATNYVDIKRIFQRVNFTYSVCLDINDSLNIINHLPADERFHCFLLDEQNRVVLIGNPVQSPKIRDLYIRTICERLELENPSAQSAPLSDRNTRNLGSFPFYESMNTMFVLKNDTDTEMRVDTVYTSCDCTTATIDRMQIEPHGRAEIAVRFKTDRPETFMREIYVKTADTTHVFTIRGEAQ